MKVSSKRKSKKDNFNEGKVLWDDSYLKKEDGAINIGIDCNNKEVVVDFNKTNHIIVAGETGTGKTVMIKNILWQFISKNDRVIAVDLLHDGLEFEEKYKKCCDVITEEEMLLKELEELLKENQLRKDKLKVANCSNINEYNKNNSEKMKRVILGIDDIVGAFLNENKTDLHQKIRMMLSMLIQESINTGIHVLIVFRREEMVNLLNEEIIRHMPGVLCFFGGDRLLKNVDLELINQRISKVAGRSLYQDADGIQEVQGYLVEERYLVEAGYLEE